MREEKVGGHGLPYKAPAFKRFWGLPGYRGSPAMHVPVLTWWYHEVLFQSHNPLNPVQAISCHVIGDSGLGLRSSLELRNRTASLRVPHLPVGGPRSDTATVHPIPDPLSLYP